MDIKRKVVNMSVYIIDEHPIVRESLATLIHTRLGMRVIGSSETHPNLFTDIAKEKPGLVIVDANMSTAKIVSNIRKAHLAAKILIYSGSNERVYSSRAFQIGVNGFVSRRHSFDILLNAIKLITNDFNCFPSYSDENDEVTPSVLSNLSKREISIAIALTKGLKNNEISRFFNISEKTVSSHKKNILAKLRIDSVIGLAGLFESSDFIN
ncbi:LuxR C-terminal-related transcriptional regulator [Serratia sp. D1N4]